MLRAIVVDDEKRGREVLQNLVKEHCNGVLVMDAIGTIDEAIESIAKHKPDLLFLDIELTDGTGFDLLNRVAIDFEVIFTTAYENYALKAIKFSAIDYLLKPVDVGELIKAVDKAADARSIYSFKSRYENVNFNIQNSSNKANRLAIPLQDGLLFVDIQDILRCIAEGAYTYFHLKNGAKHLVSKNLKEYDELLSGSGFCRVHHSYLINLNEVKKYVKGEGGYVVMTDDFVVEVSRRKKDTLLAHFKRI